MRDFKQFELFYDTEGENGTGAGVGTDNQENTETEETKTVVDNSEELKRMATEINSLKSQLGHAKKETEKFKNAGKSKEELLEQEKANLEKELSEAKIALNISQLAISKSTLLEKYKVNPIFADLVTLKGEMTEEELEEEVKKIANKQNEFEKNLLKQYSVSIDNTTSSKTKKNEFDFVDKMLEKKKNQTTNLLDI